MTAVDARPRFRPGRNIAMKIPAPAFEATLVFYRDTLGLVELSEDAEASKRFAFGDKILWLDPVNTLSQAEIWLEIVAEDIVAAAQYLDAQACTRCDQIETLPADLQGFWISSPSQIIHLVCAQDSAT